MVKIKQQLVASRAKTSKGTNGCKYITIHETANTSKGADAQAHANLQTNGFTASWHWQVDDKQAIQSFPHNVRCWHAGDGTGNGNFNSIGIEICVNSDGDFKQAVKNAAALVKKIMADEGIPLSNVVQHNKWSGKNCPTNLRNGSKGIDWSEFIALVEGDEVEQVSKPTSTPKQPVSKPSTNQTTSIVDYLNSKKINSSPTNRKKLAVEYGVKNYDLTGAKNTELLNKMRAGKPVSKPAAKPKPKGKTLHLPKTASSWRVYPTNKAPVKANALKTKLNPKKFGGLSYPILGNPQKDVYTIQTAQLGKVNIYAGPGTGAVIK